MSKWEILMGEAQLKLAGGISMFKRGNKGGAKDANLITGHPYEWNAN